MISLAGSIIPLAILTFVLLLVLNISVKVSREYERGVMLRLGQLSRVRGPGLLAL